MTELTKSKREKRKKRSGKETIPERPALRLEVSILMLKEKKTRPASDTREEKKKGKERESEEERSFYDTHFYGQGRDSVKLEVSRSTETLNIFS